MFLTKLTHSLAPATRCLNPSTAHLRLRGEEGARHSVHVLGADLDADVAEAHLVKTQRASSRADVTLTSVRREGDRVPLVAPRQVVTDGAVHIVLKQRRC